MKLLRLPRSKVQLGIALPWNVRDEHSLLLLSKGHIVESEQQLEALLERGAFVDIEEVKAAGAKATMVSVADPAKTMGAAANVFGLWDQTTDRLVKLMTHVAQQPDFPESIDQFALHIVELVDLNPDIAIYRSVRQDNAKNFYYGYTHAVFTAVLCILMSRHLKWSTVYMMSLVKAALTMNMTILELQGQMAGQEDPMKEKQRALIQQHPVSAVELLQKVGVKDPDWLAAVAQHHERADGTGYPLSCKDIGEIGVALRVADVFMAKISPRVLRTALSPQEAIRQLYREDNGGPISTAIIKEFGIYPPGDFVKLASGELGLVVQRTANARAPIVASITDTDGRPVARTLRHDTAQPGFAIVGSATDKAMLARLPPERLYGYSAAPAA